MSGLAIDEFRHIFFDLTENWSWEVQGFIDSNSFVHPIDSDTKVISTVFERMAAPALRSIATKFGYRVELANQTTYPDFTITNEMTSHRIALDIKTTYVRNRMVFTLGGYNSFLRNNTKNILYPYNTYRDHWILGFVYRQLDSFTEYDLDNLPKAGDISCPYKVETVFIREKHELCGLQAGSGNTKNIGSFVGLKPRDFEHGVGPFGAFASAKEACDFYWANYETYYLAIRSVDQLLSHADFERFK
ncbi:type II restriction endonuclease [Sphingopyxis sp.]|uniref:type II restriction endonuclease n=1 Tax=Sphingopyxis sp. TaxID=1908224 RepID=UPI003D6D996E